MAVEGLQQTSVPKTQLGKRHVYKQGEIDADIATSARSIGFSAAEIAELERLYREKPTRNEF